MALYKTALMCLFLLAGTGSAFAAGDLSGKLYSLSEGGNCEVNNNSDSQIGTLPELKNRIAGKKGIYCVSWSILKNDYENLNNPTIYIGRVGDVSELYLNKTKIGLTSRIPGAGWHLQSLHSYYYLPAGLLGEKNTITLKISKFFLSGSGPLDNIMIGDWDDIRREARYQDYLNSDLLVFLSILFVVVGALIFGIFRHHPSFGNYVTLSFTCVTGGLFSITLSRILYVFCSNYGNIYRLNCTAGILFFYFLVSYFYRDIPKAGLLRGVNAAGTILFAAGVIFSVTIQTTASFYAVWMFFLYFNLISALVVTIVWRSCFGDILNRITAVGVILIAVTHDIMIYLGYITGGNITPYAIFFVLLSFVFVILTDMQQIYIAASRTDFAIRERNRLQEDLVQVAKSAVIGQMAAQVAHDIRSPLAALDAALKNTDELPEGRRVIVRHAVNRIRDIANNLLEKNRLPEKSGVSAANADSLTSATGELPEAQLLSSIIDPLMTEKRMQFEGRAGIEIDFELTPSSYGLFAKIQPVEFRRIISNLVNNAVEAVEERGAVKVGLTRKGDDVELTIVDNGKGIRPEILSRLGKRGETYGKAAGSGLGLYHARTTAEAWGGMLEISSVIGKGTTVTLRLPMAEAPAEFVPELSLISGRPVIILDDDEAIHQIWRARFESFRISEFGIDVISFSAPDKFREWVKSNLAKAREAVYLLDYELLGYMETGLSLAREMHLEGKVIMVTSRNEEKNIVSECRRLKIGIIPKSLAMLAPISITHDAGQIITVLLDDDMLVHMNWKMAAKAAGAEFKSYKTPQDFAADISDLPKDAAIYIDSELGNNIKGEDIAKDLHAKGFSDLSMATGHVPEKFAHLPWLKVTGKEPPWA